MRLVTLRTRGGTRAARVEGDELVVLEAPDVGALLASGDWPAGAAAPDRPRVPYVAADLAPLVPRPPKIVCVGLNYRAHIREMGRDIPAHPTFFAKFASALIGPCDDITLPAVSEEVDWEAELGVVVGGGGRHVDRGGAAAAIAGYTVINDVSVRDWQRRSPQWLAGKTFEATTPVGPELVTLDEVDHAEDLEVTCLVDGEVMQRARTSDLVFDPTTILADLSVICRLEPGDVIATGTPGGVGAGRQPPRFLQPGQVVTTSVEGVGTCRNRCRREAAP